MPDDLYQRYMRAYQDADEHTRGCAACQPNDHCPTGKPLHDRLARLQEAYNERLRQRRR
ncbi:hypothetical protein J7E88_33060 [Streptomyces sp. ISL-10]|uniref:hypothetical protein n=1 Tax=Streptomyces sp. ISL-10 TaxID=2819172 RepID=UPI001BEB0304|nr:hypothetical protein [Streptomyces sp. ISL-10]MBT2369969.1 hypothetical protein [Streptomyces sp. ISL-10]